MAFGNKIKHNKKVDKTMKGPTLYCGPGPVCQAVCQQAIDDAKSILETGTVPEMTSMKESGKLDAHRKRLLGM